MLAIIGGTGLTQLADVEITRRQVMRTPYGEPSGALTFARIGCHDVVFLARHGYGHTIPPHDVNYRANIWALKEQGTTQIVSIATVGGIAQDMMPGVICIPNQLIDYTWGRKGSFYEPGEGKPVLHMDFTEPYCEEMRQRCMEAARRAGENYVDGGVYGCVQGPRLETAAEINRMDRDGATMVGMTGMPEATLAKEIGIDYAAIAVVANHAAGRAASRHGISFVDIDTVLKDAMQRVRRILEKLVDLDGCKGSS